MDLPSTYKFQGWSIRYNLLKSNQNTTTSDRPQQVKSVVFVHGTPWSSAVYRPIVEALLARGSYQILIYDLPGYGQSQDLDESTSTTAAKGDFAGDTSVAFQALALTALLKHVHLDGKDGHPIPAVIAHDIAGTIVLRAHLLHGADFDTMFLAETNCVLPWGDGFYKLVRTEPSTFLQLPPPIFAAVVRAVIRSACHDTNVLQTGWEDTLAHPWTGTPSSCSAEEAEQRQRSFVRQIAQANDADVAGMLEGDLYGRVRCDVKIIWGEQDQWIPREKVEDLIRQLGGRVKGVVFVPDAGHLVMLDQPARFAVEVFDWLVRFGSARSLGSVRSG